MAEVLSAEEANQDRVETILNGFQVYPFKRRNNLAIKLPYTTFVSGILELILWLS